MPDLLSDIYDKYAVKLGADLPEPPKDDRIEREAAQASYRLVQQHLRRVRDNGEPLPSDVNTQRLIDNAYRRMLTKGRLMAGMPAIDDTPAGPDRRTVFQKHPEASAAARGFYKGALSLGNVAMQLIPGTPSASRMQPLIEERVERTFAPPESLAGKALEAIGGTVPALPVGIGVGAATSRSLMATVARLSPTAAKFAAPAVTALAVSATNVPAVLANAPDQFNRLREQGMSEASAIKTVIRGGVIESLITGAFGKTGAEALLSPNKLARNVAWKRLQAAAKEGGMEGIEEATQQWPQAAQEYAISHPGSSVAEALRESLPNAGNAQDYLVSFLAGAGLGGAVGALQVRAPKAIRPVEAMPQDEEISPAITAVPEAMLVDPKRLNAWVQSQPEKAKALAQAEVPSRAVFEAAGLAGRLNEEQRAALQNQVRDALAGPDESAALARATEIGEPVGPAPEAPPAFPALPEGDANARETGEGPQARGVQEELAQGEEGRVRLRNPAENRVETPSGTQEGLQVPVEGIPPAPTEAAPLPRYGGEPLLREPVIPPPPEVPPPAPSGDVFQDVRAIREGRTWKRIVHDPAASTTTVDPLTGFVTMGSDAMASDKSARQAWVSGQRAHTQAWSAVPADLMVDVEGGGKMKARELADQLGEELAALERVLVCLSRG